MADKENGKDKADEPYVSPNDVVDSKGNVSAQSPAVVGKRISALMDESVTPTGESKKPSSYKVVATWQDSPAGKIPHEKGATVKAGDIVVPEAAIQSIIAREKKRKREVTPEQARQRHIDNLVAMGLLEPVGASKAETPTTETNGGGS